MSRENVELVRKHLEAFERGDFDAVFAVYDPGIEWVAPRFAPGIDLDPVYVGHEGVRTFFRRWYEAWERVSFDYEEYIGNGDKVVSVLSQKVKGRMSGVELEFRSYGIVWTLRAGIITRAEFTRTRGEALEAVGLSE